MYPRFRISLPLALAAHLLSLTPTLNAQQIISSAVDIAGKRYVDSRDFPGARVPWMRDCIAYAKPEYPYEGLRDRREGVGLFRMLIDGKSGRVAQVEVVKSTGFRVLDESAIEAVRRWRWKPEKWKEVNIPIKFTLGSSSGNVDSGIGVNLRRTATQPQIRLAPGMR